MVDITDPRPILRQELARVFKNQRVIRAFEKIFDLIPPEFINQQVQIDTLGLIAEVANSQSVEALAAIERLTSAIEMLAMGPPAFQYSDLVNLSSVPALDTTITVTWTGLHTFSAGINVTGAAAVTGNITATTTIAATGTISGSNLSATGGTNPSASVGLSAVNGSAITYMRSDGSPALSQAIAPTWTGTHIFTNASYVARFENTLPLLQWSQTGAAADTKLWWEYITGGKYTMAVVNDSGSTVRNYLEVTRTVNAVSAIAYGNATDNPTYTFLGTGVPKHGGNQLIQTSAALTNNAAAAIGTLNNAPVAGNPTKWIPINDNGTIRNIPAW